MSTSIMPFLIILIVLVLAAQAVHGDDYHVYALKKRVAFFDRNHDGIIYIPETVEGMKAIGLGTIKAMASATVIHFALSSKTRPDQSFDIRFPIEIENIKYAKHTSDSDSYDNEGRFVSTKFEEVFVKNARSNSDALTWDELDQLLKVNREPNDFFGWVAAKAEWKMLFEIGKDANNLLQKGTIRKVFDGSLFYEIEKRRSEN